MDHPEFLTALIAFVVIATITPGGATTLAVASGAQHGFRRSIPLIAGMAGGLCSLGAGSALGLGTAIHTFPQIQVIMQGLGSAYLLWLAWKIARSGAPNATASERRSIGLGGGLLLLWLNPKAWTVTLAAAAAFANLTASATSLAIIMGLAFGVAGSVSLSIWCMGGLLLSQLLRTERQWNAVNGLLAIALVLCIVPLWL
ncbi:LysE family translocator [Aquibium carbonis]|uniref:LysE family translocator n=1 Tax=Aquibium carbonis TaxID=2495581 RepID=A0A429YVX2_9HYPH|nr:LysE family translocator [Aquibium carbonis]RST85613.1 LysE family translocator [Aquibium carbonis]